MRNGQVEEVKLINLRRELKLKEFQFNSIFEFSESIYSSLDTDNIFRIYFSTLMTQLGVSRVFVYHSPHNLLRKRGFRGEEEREKIFDEHAAKLGHDWFQLKVEDLGAELEEFKAYLEENKILSLVNISETEEKTIILGLGAKFNKKELTAENIEYAFFVSKFAVSAIDNAFLINKLIESKRLEHEIQIARDIQLSLLPQSVPELENFEISVIYQPIFEVGGDYYDILKQRRDGLPVLIADVEGKGLSAALLAASSQAIFHSLNELYFFEPCKFITKANEMICNFTKGGRFITLFWMLLHDEEKAITYVNAGHESPFLLSGDSVTLLEKGGFLTGFLDSSQYEKETIYLKSGDIIAAFTDGVPEVENRQGEEFGKAAMIKFLQENRELSAKELTQALQKRIMDFSEQIKPRDDFTLIVLKVK